MEVFFIEIKFEKLKIATPPPPPPLRAHTHESSTVMIF